jgi:hypothetical protein
VAVAAYFKSHTFTCTVTGEAPPRLICRAN